MSNLILLKTIYDTFSDEDFEKSIEYFDFMERLDQLTNVSDIVKVTYPNGEGEYRAKVNFNGGRCDCCKKYNRVSKYDFYRVEG